MASQSYTFHAANCLKAAVFLHISRVSGSGLHYCIIRLFSISPIHGQQIRLGIQADDRFLILREELEEGGALPTPSQAAG